MAAPSETRIVLMGKTGNGKSSTGNSILGRSAFKTSLSAKAVTSTCQLESGAIGPAGRIVHVIDTPGFFEASESQERVRDEIVKCLELAKDGVHAFVLVLSVGNRFTEEEVAVVESLQLLFGQKVIEYMVVLFTGGDALEGRTLAEHMHASGATGPLEALLTASGGRKVLFDNKTGDKELKEKQVAALLRTVDTLVGRNGGRPYTNELFEEAKALAVQKSRLEKEHADKLQAALNEKIEEKIQRSVAVQLEVPLKEMKRKLEVLEARGRASDAKHLQELKDLLETVQELKNTLERQVESNPQTVEKKSRIPAFLLADLDIKVGGALVYMQACTLM